MPEWRITRLRGEFCLTWDEGDIRRRYRLHTQDAKEAARRAPARYAELTRPKGSTVKDLWDSYTLDKGERSVVTTMKYTWKALEPHFGAIEGEAVTVADCRAYTKARRDAGKKDGSIHTELGHLRSVLVWAHKQRLITHAPHIERPAKPEPKEGYLTRPEVSALMDKANSPHVRLAILLRKRPQEARQRQMGPVPVPPRHLSDSFGGQEGNYGRSLPFRVFLPQVPPRFKSPPAQEDQTNGGASLSLGLPLHAYPVRKAGIRVWALALLLTLGVGFAPSASA